MKITIRPEMPDDREAVRKVHESAFESDDEARLVEAVREGGFAVVSLVALVEGALVGHILFSRLAIKTESQSLGGLSLAPMAVLPGYQRRGIGSRLVEAGSEACREQGHRIVLVLGHPEFYPRFGFSAELARPIESPFGGGEAWMALELEPGAMNGIEGRVEFSPPFRMFEPALQIVPVKREQFADWLRLREAVYSGLARSFHEQEMESIFADEDKLVLLAVAGGRGVGMIEVSLRNIVDGCLTSPVGYVEGISVDSAFRGAGLSRRLLEKAEDWCRSKGCREIATDAELDNTEAQRFHRHMGFEETYRIVEFKKTL